MKRFMAALCALALVLGMSPAVGLAASSEEIREELNGLQEEAEALEEQQAALEAQLSDTLEEIEEICEREEKADQMEWVTDTAPVADAIDQIEKIQKLLEAGVITEEEFSTIKARIISEM